MPSTFTSFSSLYLSTLLMLVGSGLLSTYLGLRLSADNVNAVWIGLLMTGYYVGLVMGATVGHRLIARVGHIRAFVASAGVVTASVLCHALTSSVEVWLALRWLVGLGMMCQYMVLESWLNEQAETHQRGRVFAGYMLVTFLGLGLGQLLLTLMPELTFRHVVLVAICFSLCLVPVAVTRRLHPAPLHPAPLEVRLFIRRIPQALSTIAVAGLILGGFYGLAPAYAATQGLDTHAIGIFMAVTIGAGLFAQAPTGWLSDRIDRSRMIQVNAILLTTIALMIALTSSPLLLMVLTGLFGLMAFTLYPLAVALANDHVDQERRVQLAATLLMTFGLGASAGPLFGAALMELAGPGMLYVFMACSSLLLVVFVRPERVTGENLVEEAPVQFMPAAGNLATSPLAAAIDPRVDEQVVIEQMQDEEPIAEEAVDEDDAEHRPG